MLLCALSLPISLSTATAFVQQAQRRGFGGSAPTLAFGSNTAADSIVAVHIQWGSTTFTLDSVTDTQSNTYTILNNPTTNTDGGFRSAMAYTWGTPAAALTITTTFSADPGRSAILMHEISGGLTTDPIDGNAINNQTNPGTGTDAVTSTAITPSQDNSYLFGAVTASPAGANYSTGTGWTTRLTGTVDQASEEIIQGSAGSQAATFTCDENFTETTTSIMAFKEAAVAGGIGITGPVVLTGPVKVTD